GLLELQEMGMLEQLPKITIIQAEGANPLYQLWQQQLQAPSSKLQAPIQLKPLKGASTLATAIKIGNPVSWPKALRGLLASQGEVEQVSEQEIADAKAMIGRDGIGCEPASAVTLAGIRKMVAAGSLDPSEDVVAILTGHVLKDPDYVVSYHRGQLSFTDKTGEKHLLASPLASQWLQVAAERSEIERALGL
ncbi:MAG: pyridoxal-phosphate dependent enzyme, partial [Blastocatellia bacterium]